MKKAKNIVWGIIFIALAVLLVASKLGFVMIPKFPVVPVVISVALAYGAIKELVKLDFVGGLIPIAIIIWLLDDELTMLTGLKITSITPWIAILGAILLGIGLELIFKGHKNNKHVSFKFDSKDKSENGKTDIESNFTGATKYITGEIDEVNLENNFGKTTVYFDNAIIAHGQAVANVENNFGATELYIPKTWRADVKQDVAFGNVKFHGTGNNDADAPLLIINVESNFGEVGIYFV